jgi:hypothetical protein
VEGEEGRKGREWDERERDGGDMKGENGERIVGQTRGGKVRGGRLRLKGIGG